MSDRVREPPESSSPGSSVSQSRVRGRPFQSGNPGRPTGSKNKTTRILEQLVEGEGETITLWTSFPPNCFAGRVAAGQAHGRERRRSWRPVTKAAT